MQPVYDPQFNDKSKEPIFGSRHRGPQCFNGGEERRAHKSGSSSAHNRSTLAAHLPPSNHRPTRNRRVPSHRRPAISATNRRRAYIACTPCMSLPNLRFLDPHFPHAFTTRLVGWLLLVLVEVSL